MKRIPLVLITLMLVSVCNTLGQAPQMPKPGPEHKRLAYFLGTWTAEADTKESPFGPAGKVKISGTNEWLAGEFFLVLREEGTTPFGEVKSLAVMGYDTQEKVYTYHAFNNIGMTEISKRTVQGDTWTFTSESQMMGKHVKSKFEMKELSLSSYSFKWDGSFDGGPWSTVMEGKATKVK